MAEADQVAHLSPACFNYDEDLDRVFLIDEATGETLIASVAANLGFMRLSTEETSVFDGRRGNTFLKVIEGVATEETIEWLASQIQDGQTIVVAACGVMDGVREYLRRLCRGSRVVVIPDDIFRFSNGGEE